MGYQFTNNWPYNYSVFPSMDDHVDPVNNIYFTGLHQEIENIEDELGLDPAGDFVTVRNRLDDIDSTIAAMPDLRPFAKIVGFDNESDYICDGVADNVQIQAAIDDLTNGGIVLLREGTYDITTPIDISNNKIYLLGSGAATILSRTDGNCNIITATNNNDIIIKDLTLYSNGTSYKGLEINSGGGCDRLLIDNVTFDFQSAGNEVIYIINSTKVTMKNCRLYSKKYIGKIEANHVIITDNYIQTNPTDPLYGMLTISGSDYIRITGNLFFPGQIALATKCQDMIISNNEFNGNYGGGPLNRAIYIAAASETVKDMMITNNTFSVLVYGVYFITGGGQIAIDTMIEGNRFRQCTTGIYINDANIKYTMIHGNNFFGCTTTITDNGTNTRTRDNIDNTATRTWHAET